MQKHPKILNAYLPPASDALVCMYSEGCIQKKMWGGF